MAKTFKISLHRNGGNIHLRLIGEFDEASAREIMDAIRQYGYGASTAFIHTNCLNQIHRFDREIFEKKSKSPHGPEIAFVFTGKYASQLAPAESTVY
ncbi:hypothetical protein ACFL7M_00305 [Thermodesulfobacteriota bacterium]